jgi:hypothetical protein
MALQVVWRNPELVRRRKRWELLKKAQTPAFMSFSNLSLRTRMLLEHDFEPGSSFV